MQGVAGACSRTPRGSLYVFAFVLVEIHDEDCGGMGEGKIVSV